MNNPYWTYFYRLLNDGCLREYLSLPMFEIKDATAYLRVVFEPTYKYLYRDMDNPYVRKEIVKRINVAYWHVKIAMRDAK